MWISEINVRICDMLLNFFVSVYRIYLSRSNLLWSYHDDSILARMCFSPENWPNFVIPISIMT